MNKNFYNIIEDLKKYKTNVKCNDDCVCKKNEIDEDFYIFNKFSKNDFSKHASNVEDSNNDEIEYAILIKTIGCWIQLFVFSDLFQNAKREKQEAYIKIITDILELISV